MLLRGWYLLTGETVFALRYGGVLLALLAVPLIYQLGRAIGGQQVGLTAALLLAVSPFHIWQSQVLRNYGLLVTLNLLGTYALWRIFQEAKRPWAWLALWVVATLLGIYTHYFGFFFLAYSLVMLTIWVAQAWGGTQLATLLRQRWLWLALLLIALLLVPAVQIGLDRFQAGQQVDFYYIPPSVVARHALSAFTVGMSPSLSHPWNYIWPSLALAIVGLGMATRPRPITAVFLLGYQLIPSWGLATPLAPQPTLQRHAPFAHRLAPIFAPHRPWLGAKTAALGAIALVGGGGGRTGHPTQLAPHPIHRPPICAR